LITTLTTLNYKRGHGKDVVDGLVDANKELLVKWDNAKGPPPAMSVYSVPANTRAYGASGKRKEGHTGVVYAVIDNTLYIADTFEGFYGNGSRVRFDTVEWDPNTSVSFVYVGGYIR
jgi:hypothetical protein